MSDLPLDETALQAAGRKIGKMINWVKGAEGEARAKQLARAAVSTYLGKAFEVERHVVVDSAEYWDWSSEDTAAEAVERVRKERPSAVSIIAEQKLHGPWVPVVQAENEDEPIAEQMEKWDP
jgi:hypothetical protein